MIARQGLEERIEWFAKTASTLFTVGDFVTITANLLIPCGTTSIPVGIVMTNVPASDATNNPLMVDTPFENDDFIMDVATGTVSTAIIGTLVDIDAAVPGALDVTSSATGQVFVVDILPDTNQVIGRVAKVLYA